MANLSQFINELAAITGTKSDQLAPFIEATKATEIPDDVIAGIKAGILTMESAKNNPQIKDHFLATMRAGVDDEIYTTMKEYGLDDATIAEAKNEAKTTAKVRVLALKIKEAQEKKISATGGDKKVLADKIADLETQLANVNAQAAQQKEAFEAKVTENKNEFVSRLRDYQVDKHFQGYTYANEKVPLDVHIMTAKGLFDKKAKELGLKTIFDEQTGQVKLLTSTDTIYYKDNKPVDFKGFTDSLLAENHLLKVSEPPKKESEGSQQQNFTPSNGSGDKKINTSKFSEALTTASKNAVIQTN